MKNYTQQIEQLINKMKPGTVFINPDFLDICSYTTINRIILRLIKQNKIIKILKGIYCKPNYNKTMNVYISPSIISIAYAIARNYGWNIVPIGDSALNMLGLSNQVPSTWTFVTDGTYRTYTYGKNKIIFKRTTNKNISKLSNKTALVVQAFKALGKDNIDKSTIEKLKSNLSLKDKQIALKEAKYSTKWIYENVRKICLE